MKISDIFQNCNLIICYGVILSIFLNKCPNLFQLINFCVIIQVTFTNLKEAHNSQEIINCSAATDLFGIFAVVVTLQATAEWSALDFYHSHAPLCLVMTIR